jgi:uncharacterized protein YcbK (DUF882 family)
MILEGLKVVSDFISQHNIKFFSPYEFVCPCCGHVKIDTDLIFKLEEIRKSLQRPIVITSAYRCERHNKEVGGKPDSAHLKGLAVDIKVDNSRERFEIVTEALRKGFVRIGVAKTFVHIDLDKSKPQKVIWVY